MLYNIFYLLISIFIKEDLLFYDFQQLDFKLQNTISFDRRARHGAVAVCQIRWNPEYVFRADRHQLQTSPVPSVMT